MQPIAPSLEPRPSLRAIRWKHPRRQYPAVLELALSRLNTALDTPRGPLFVALFGGAPVAGRKLRERRKRMDGATNCITVLSTCLASADLRRGLIATPLGEGWERKKWTDIDALGFGPLVSGERGLRRTERAAAELVQQGYLRSIPWRVATSEGVRAIPGLKFVTDKLWKILGLWDALRSERRRRQQREGEEKKAELENQLGGIFKRVPDAKRRPVPAARHQMCVGQVPPKPPPDSAAATQAAGEVAAAAIEAMKKIFGVR